MSVYGKLLQNHKNISESSSFLTVSDIPYPPYTLTSITAISSNIITSRNNVIDIKFTPDSSAIPEGYEEYNTFYRNTAFDYYVNPDNELQWCIKGTSSHGGIALTIGFSGTTPSQNVTLRIEAYDCSVYITYFDVVTNSVNNAPLNIVRLENSNQSWKTLNIYSDRFSTLRDHLKNFPIFINVAR